MPADIAAAFASLTALRDLLAAGIGERDRQKAATIEADFTKRILELQAELAQMFGTIVEKDRALHLLGERIRELEARESEKARYQLSELGAVGKTFAYRLRPTAELLERADEPEHFLCQPCFDGGKKSVLQFDAYSAHCLVCGKSLAVKSRPPLQPRRNNSWRAI